MTLGNLIRKLEEFPKDRTVRYDFCDLIPTDLDSWRGVYAELALGWSEDTYPSKAPNVEQLLGRLRAADGVTYEGYKGGEYKMDMSTPIHVDNPGRYTQTDLVGVLDGGYCVILETRTGKE